MDMIIDDILDDEYDRLLTKTPRAERPDEAERIIETLTMNLCRFMWAGFGSKKEVIERLERSLPSKH